MPWPLAEWIELASVLVCMLCVCAGRWGREAFHCNIAQYPGNPFIFFAISSFLNLISEMTSLPSFNSEGSPAVGAELAKHPYVLQMKDTCEICSLIASPTHPPPWKRTKLLNCGRHASPHTCIMSVWCVLWMPWKWGCNGSSISNLPAPHSTISAAKKQHSEIMQEVAMLSGMVVQPPNPKPERSALKSINSS